MLGGGRSRTQRASAEAEAKGTSLKSPNVRQRFKIKVVTKVIDSLLFCLAFRLLSFNAYPNRPGLLVSDGTIPLCVF